MIIIKTNLKKLPDGCWYCYYSYIKDYDLFCGASGNKVLGNEYISNKCIRCALCPLLEQERKYPELDFKEIN